MVDPGGAGPAASFPLKLVSFGKNFLPGKKMGASPCFLVQGNYYYQIRITYNNMEAAQRAQASGQEFGAPVLKGKTPLNHKEKGV
jgi:hypothetical protein